MHSQKLEKKEKRENHFRISHAVQQNTGREIRKRTWFQLVLMWTPYFSNIPVSHFLFVTKEKHFVGEQWLYSWWSIQRSWSWTTWNNIYSLLPVNHQGASEPWVVYGSWDMKETDILCFVQAHRDLLGVCWWRTWLRHQWSSGGVVGMTTTVQSANMSSWADRRSHRSGRRWGQVS